MSKDYHTPESITDMARILEEASVEIRDCAGKMRSLRIKKLEVNFEKSRLKAMMALGNWTATLQRSIRENQGGIKDRNFTSY